MPYSVQFVGLACFVRDRGARNVLLPDGREPGPGIDPHVASIVVPADAVEDAVGWPDGEAASRGTFALSPCKIVFEGADQSGALDTTAHDGRLPELRKMNPAFSIDPARAGTIATVDIRQGKLTAYRVPRGEALMTELEVPHEGSISIRVLPAGEEERTIRVKPGTEIALTNTAEGGYAAASQHSGHFRIYEKLSANPVTLHAPASVADVPPSPSRHPVFQPAPAALRVRTAGLSTDCSNTGCC